MIHILDLGGTSNYGRDAVGIDLDGTYVDSDYDDDPNAERSHHIIGDYNHAPFPDNTFDEANGSCYLEEEYDLKELYRIMKPGGIVTIKSCTDTQEAHIRHVENMQASGFIIDVLAELYEDSNDLGTFWYDYPFKLRKP